MTEVAEASEKSKLTFPILCSSSRLVSPVITIAPPPLVSVTKTYDTVILQCAARGSPVPTLEWSKDGVVISTNTTTKSAEEVKGELVIPRFGPADRGVYKCFFKNYDNGTAEILTTTGNNELSFNSPRKRNVLLLA